MAPEQCAMGNDAALCPLSALQAGEGGRWRGLVGEHFSRWPGPQRCCGRWGGGLEPRSNQDCCCGTGAQLPISRCEMGGAVKVVQMLTSQAPPPYQVLSQRC